MVTFVNPAQELDDLVGFFEIAADEGGASVDAELCRIFAHALADLGEKLEALVAFARAMGLVEMIEPDTAPRTPAERARLARELVTESRGARVVVLPTLLRTPVAFGDGGTAA